MQPHGSEAEAEAVDNALAIAAWLHAGLSPNALRALMNSGIWLAPEAPPAGAKEGFFYAQRKKCRSEYTKWTGHPRETCVKLAPCYFNPKE